MCVSAARCTSGKSVLLSRYLLCFILLVVLLFLFLFLFVPFHSTSCSRRRRRWRCWLTDWLTVWVRAVFVNRCTPKTSLSLRRKAPANEPKTKKKLINFLFLSRFFFLRASDFLFIRCVCHLIDTIQCEKRMKNEQKKIWCSRMCAV